MQIDEPDDECVDAEVERAVDEGSSPAKTRGSHEQSDSHGSGGKKDRHSSNTTSDSGPNASGTSADDDSESECTDEIEVSPYHNVKELCASEWLDRMARGEYDKQEEEESDDEEDNELPSIFDAHFLSYPPNSTPPQTCHLPVLVMAENKDVGVLMSSLLYQRRVWHIQEPLIGIGFEKYETVIRLYVGWLDEEILPGNTLVSLARYCFIHS